MSLLARCSTCVAVLAFAASGCDSEPSKPLAGPTNKPAAQTPGAETTSSPTPDHAALYDDAKARLEAGQLDGVEADFRSVANGAKDPIVRANAAMALGAVLGEKGDRAGAVSAYRLAQSARPESPEPLAVLGLALEANGDYPEAIEVQKSLCRMTPNDLRAWLILGEMSVKGGDEAGAKVAYGSYEMRRKGLLDGLTLKADGTYELDVASRVEVVEWLEAATDEGTGLALLYALESDPAKEVRDAIVESMGYQRLRGYEEGLRKHLDREPDPESKKLAQWALDEIARDPVDLSAASAPSADLDTAPADPQPVEPAVEPADGPAVGAQPEAPVERDPAVAPP